VTSVAVVVLMTALLQWMYRAQSALRYFNASNTLIYSITVEYKHWRVGQVVLPDEGAGT